MKKLFILLSIGLCFVSTLYAGETLTAQQKEARVWFGKGMYSFGTEQNQSAIDNYTKAIELDPEYAAAYANRAAAYHNIGQTQQAIDDYTKAMEINPKLDAYCNRGKAYGKQGEYQQAIDDFTKAIKLNPELSDAYRGRGVAYLSLELLTTACDDFYEAGLLYLKQSDKKNALTCVDLMKQADSKSPLIKKLMDKIYAEPKKSK